MVRRGRYVYVWMIARHSPHMLLPPQVSPGSALQSLMSSFTQHQSDFPFPLSQSDIIIAHLHSAPRSPPNHLTTLLGSSFISLDHTSWFLSLPDHLTSPLGSSFILITSFAGTILTTLPTPCVPSPRSHISRSLRQSAHNTPSQARHHHTYHSLNWMVITQSPTCHTT